MRLEIMALPKWKDVVTVKTWINTLENSRSVRAFEMYVNGKKMIGSETFWAVFNTKMRRPEGLALPYDHFELYPEIKATQKSFSKINIPDNNEMVFEKTVVLSDLDIVNHVNNVKYLEWCLDHVDETVNLNQNIESLEMNFLKELLLSDFVEIHQSNTEESSIFSITKESKSVFALQLNWK